MRPRRRAPAGRSRRSPRVRRRGGRCSRLRSPRRATPRPPASATRAASAARSTAPRFEWRSSMPSASLVILAGPPAMVTRATGRSAQIFEQPADEIAHLDQRMIGQTVERADGGLGGFARRRADMRASARTGDVDAAVDRVDPGRAGIGHDDPGRAEDRQAADDAEPAVGGALGDLRAARHRDLDAHVERRRRACSATSSRLARIIARGAGLIAGSPGGSGRPGPGHRPDAFAGPETEAGALGAKRTVATISAPCVTSGSSPASLTTPARAKSASGA